MNANIDRIIDYLMQHYTIEDAERLTRIKMVGAMANMDELPAGYQDVISKVALFNNIKEKA